MPGREEGFERWEDSEERRRWPHEVQPLLREGPGPHRPRDLVHAALETREIAPPRYKMAAVTWLAVFPLITVIFVLFEPLLYQLLMALRTLVATVVMVTLMTYVIMPRLFAFWLYPDRGGCITQIRK